MSVIIDQTTLKVVGINRPPFSNEFAVDVDATGLTKEVSYTESVQKTNGEGKELFLLPQPDLVEEIESSHDVETTEETNRPILVPGRKQVPLLQAGKPVMYQRTQRAEVTEETTEPVLILETNEETGEPVEIHKTNEEGQLLYWGLVEVGEPEPVHTWEETEEHKTDAEGHKLYWKTVAEITEVNTPQPALEVTQDDPAWSDELEIITMDETKTKTVTIDTEFEHFTYQEIQTYKAGIDKGKETYLNDIGESLVSSMMGMDDLGLTIVDILERLEVLERA